MKKAISLLFLLLANMVLLTHAVIPHHHHNQIPVVLCGNQQEHNTAADKHHHHAATHPVSQCADPDNHCQGNVEDCSLIKIFVIISNDRQAIQFIDFDFEPFPYLPCLSAFSVNSITKITDFDGLPFRQKPYLISYNTEYLSVSLGLRAPPAC